MGSPRTGFGLVLSIDQSSILEIDPDREIVAIDIERDVRFFGVQIWSRVFS